MSNGVDFSTNGIGRVQIAANWLDANGRLPVCIAKPPRRVDEIANDEVVPGSSSFAHALLDVNAAGLSEVQKYFAGGTGLLLFPEYAYCSQDFGSIDSAIRKHPTGLIVLAGFGAVLGSELAKLLDAGCESTWETGAAVLTAHGRYNAGWCWIHEAVGNSRCIIFLKNYADQAAEIPGIQNLQTSVSILRIEANDVVFYPLICSDLISGQPGSPRMRIEQSLPLPGKRVAVCTMSCNDAPQSDWWKTAIDHVVQMQQCQTVLIFGNQDVTSLHADETQDRWRCLSGAFISKTRMPKAPPNPLFNMRGVSTETTARGMLLRQPDVGIAVGIVNWDPSSPAVGIYVWEDKMRLAWRNGDFLPLPDNAASYETRRFVNRRRHQIASQFAEGSRQLIEDALSTIVSEAEIGRLSPRLWPDLLDGLKAPEPPRSADGLEQDRCDLDGAFGVFAAVQAATNGLPVMQGPERGQLLWDQKELKVWRSPRLLDQQMLGSLQKLALDGGSAPPLIVIGRGRSLGVAVAAQQVEVQIPAQQALPERQTDITCAQPDSRDQTDIESNRLRPVFWRPMGEIEQVLIEPPVALAPTICATITNGFDIA